METPAWFNRANIKSTLDARPMLASGIHPLEMVLKETKGFTTGEIFEIITPFPPVPMIEKLSAAGFDHFTEPSDDGLFRTFFVKVVVP